MTATFDEAVTGVSGTTFTLEDPSATPVAATVSYDGPTKTATLDPSASLAPNTTYTAHLTSGITDTSSNANPLSPVSWSFTTAAADTTAPTVTTKTPPANASGVSPTTTVTATFDEAVTGVSGTTFTLEDPTATPVAATVSYDGPTKTATLDPSASLAPNTTYTAHLTSGITDTSSNTNPLSPVSWSFTTGNPPAGPLFRSASSADNAATTTLVLPRRPASPRRRPAGRRQRPGQPDGSRPAGWTEVERRSTARR